VKIFTVFILFFSSLLQANDIVFLGSPFSVVESEKSCDKYVESGICMDVAFELKYNVYEWYNENPEPEIIEFIGFTHSSGLPKFTSFNFSLVHLKKVNDHYLVKDIKPVVELEGEYIICVDKQLPYLSECKNRQSVKSYLDLSN